MCDDDTAAERPDIRTRGWTILHTSARVNGGEQEKPLKVFNWRYIFLVKSEILHKQELSKSCE